MNLMQFLAGKTMQRPLQGSMQGGLLGAINSSRPLPQPQAMAPATENPAAQALQASQQAMSAMRQPKQGGGGGMGGLMSLFKILMGG